MSASLRVILIIGVIAYMLLIFILLSRKKLSLKYSLLWMFSAVVFLLIAIFPDIVSWISYLLGVQTPVNGLFLVLFFCTLLLMISLTVIVSKQARQIKRLIQHTALLEKELNELKK